MERSIILKAHEVRGILDGRQSQLRRILKNQPNECNHMLWPDKMRPAFEPFLSGKWACSVCGNGVNFYSGEGVACPFGDVGDRLWVKETWAYEWNDDGQPVVPESILYAATDDWDGPRISSTHMMRGHSRILLEIVSVRVERLQDISEADARAMGHPLTWDDKHYDPPPREVDSWQGYGYASHCLKWCSDHGHESWEANPWVWVVEFKRVEAE